jgi:Flp pilus assembly protein TadD
MVPAKNDYEVERTHFYLGRLLLKSGDVAEGHKELDISRDLLIEKAQQAESRLHGSVVIKLQEGRIHEAKPEDLEAQERLESEAAHMIASSYDSLGVHAATSGDFTAAAVYFKRAAHWDSKFGNIDYKWGRAAFAAGDYAEAVAPLKRALAQHPDDDGIRSMLGMSLFVIQNYAQTYQILQPMEARLDANTPLGLAYVGSKAIAGDPREGIAQLQTMEAAHPEADEVHRLLGQAYASGKLYGQAGEELRAALRLNPGSSAAKYALALDYLQTGEKAKAQNLLTELTKSGAKDDAVFYRLGQLQLESGSIKSAIANLEMAVKLDVENAGYHRELAQAYRKNGQVREADLELEKATTLESQTAQGVGLEAHF